MSLILIKFHLDQDRVCKHTSSVYMHILMRTSYTLFVLVCTLTVEFRDHLLWMYEMFFMCEESHHVLSWFWSSFQEIHHHKLALLRRCVGDMQSFDLSIFSPSEILFWRWQDSFAQELLRGNMKSDTCSRNYTHSWNTTNISSRCDWHWAQTLQTTQS